MKRSLPIFFLVVVVVIGVVWYVNSRDGAQANDDKLTVVASFYPLAHFAEEVGRDLVNVKLPVPAGAEAHDFEPTPQDVIAAQQGDVLLYHGAGLDPWAERVAEDAADNGAVVVEMMTEFDEDDLQQGEDEEAAVPVANEDDEDDHGEGGVDPHIWIDPIFASQEVEIIRDAFIAADPDNKDAYTEHAERYISGLLALHRAYETGLSSCKKHEIIVAHDAFGYLADRYTLEVHSIAGISPNAEPSAQRLAELAELAQDNGIEYIFFETLVSPKLAETLASEVGAETLVLNPVEGLTNDQTAAGATYISVMEDNLRNLRIALQCES